MMYSACKSNKQYIVLGEAQTEIKIPGRNINNLRYADDTIFMAEN